ncbi:hypothetical protein G6F32_017490 [Rhizopus arrhizus]|nr:hypothetical protein G6F32_017490 [Rhizopus arrhizus]
MRSSAAAAASSTSWRRAGSVRRTYVPPSSKDRCSGSSIELVQLSFQPLGVLSVSTIPTTFKGCLPM